MQLLKMKYTVTKMKYAMTQVARLSANQKLRVSRFLCKSGYMISRDMC